MLSMINPKSKLSEFSVINITTMASTKISKLRYTKNSSFPFFKASLNDQVESLLQFLHLSSPAPVSYCSTRTQLHKYKLCSIL